MKSIELLVKKLSKDAQKKLVKQREPNWVDPMLATLTENYFSNANYIYEHKWDGERIVAYKKGKTVRLMTRNHKEANESYPHIVLALKKYDGDFILDGEMIASEEGKSSFGLLQLRMHTAAPKGESLLHISYHVFDLIYIDGYNITNLELLDRKFILHNSFSFSLPILLTEYKPKEGLKYFDYACKHGWEGLIAKEIHSQYEEGIRSKHWLKFKCLEGQEFVVGGFTKPQGHRLDFGALLIGYYDKDELIYAGKVGTGFSMQMLKILGDKLSKLVSSKSPFKSVDISTRDVYWVKPKLVIEVKYPESVLRGARRYAPLFQ